MTLVEPLLRRTTRARAAAVFAIASLGSWPALADNPIVQTNYTADPAPLLHDGRLYLYTSHDEDVTVKDFFTMNEWRLYSSIDMVNWTDHGSPASYKTFSWGTGDAWAPHAWRDGTFYPTCVNNRPLERSRRRVGQSAGPLRTRSETRSRHGSDIDRRVHRGRQPTFLGKSDLNT